MILTTVPKYIVNEFEKIQKTFSWKHSTLKIKHEILYNYKAEELKHIDISNKIAALQYSWIRRLYDKAFHKWKLIPLMLF